MQVHGKNVLKTGTMLMVGATLLASGLVVPAQAKDHKDYRYNDHHESNNEGKADNLKKGAIVLGAVGAVLAAKGDVLPGVIAGAGGYYLYKKGRREDRDDNHYPGYRAHNDRDHRGHDNRYDSAYRDGDHHDGDYRDGDDRDGNYPNGDYRNHDNRYDYDASYEDRNDHNNGNDRDQNCDRDQQDNNHGYNRDHANHPYAVR